MGCRFWTILAFFATFGAFGSPAQEPKSEPGTTQSAPEKVYFRDKSVTSPSLIPSSDSPTPIGTCKNEFAGKIKLSLIVDSHGLPRNIMFDKPLGTGLDILALKVAEADRFTPGSAQGKPVAVGRLVAIQLHTCLVIANDSAGKETVDLKLLSQPEQQFEDAPAPEEKVLSIPATAPAYSLEPVILIAGRMSHPVAILHPDVQYSDEARRAQIEGTCTVTLVVDAHGMPQQVKVMKSLEPSLDLEAAKTVVRYRFKPAMLDGSPVPVKITVQVNFRLLRNYS